SRDIHIHLKCLRLLAPAGCCARAASGHAAAAPPRSDMNSRRFTSNFSRATKRKIALRETYCTAGFRRSLYRLLVVFEPRGPSDTSLFVREPFTNQTPARRLR